MSSCPYTHELHRAPRRLLVPVHAFVPKKKVQVGRVWDELIVAMLAERTYAEHAVDYDQFPKQNNQGGSQIDGSQEREHRDASI